MASNERVIAGDRFNGVLMSYTTYYVGTCLVPSTGKMDRRRFSGSRGKALSDWNAWCDEVRDSDLAARKRSVSRRGGQSSPDAAESPAPRPILPLDDMPEPEKEEPPVESAEEHPEQGDSVRPDTLPVSVFVVQVVGGPAIYYTDDFDVAVQVCDGLSAGAKASGFAAAYDVAEVKRWGA